MWDLQKRHFGAKLRMDLESWRLGAFYNEDEANEDAECEL